ncbi:MAG: hypothetical protein F6J93_29520 [Oscillatoria sp. SIO1A7]|nr:hypothetical protein [Oscillatoria sp. SIO1A7]
MDYFCRAALGSLAPFDPSQGLPYPTPHTPHPWQERRRVERCPVFRCDRSRFFV